MLTGTLTLRVGAHIVIKWGISMIRYTISQPMRDKSLNEIQRERERVTSAFNALGWYFVDNMVQEKAPNVANTSLFCLGSSLVEISKCDYVVFLEGWREARGCKLEHDACEAYGVKTIEFD